MSSLDGGACWVVDRSQIGEARRMARARAAQAGLAEHRVEEVAIVASELASNLVQHADGGWFVVQRLGGAVDLLALDRGPGMADPERCFADGFSTAGTAGIGMGAIRRLSSVQALDSAPGRGTVMYARFGEPPPLGVGLGAVTRPCPGQARNGDGWRLDRRGELVRLLVVDGLGHGPGAADATAAALQTMAASEASDPVALLADLDRGLAGTRGAAATAVVIDPREGALAFAGIGNVSALVELDGETSSMVPRFGVLGGGARLRGATAWDHPWRPGCRLVVYSDGVSDRWRGDVRRGRHTRHPALLAGRVLRDHLRRTDDATCVVLVAEESEG